MTDSRQARKTPAVYSDFLLRAVANPIGRLKSCLIQK
jgi:hypothetical protein